MELQWIGDFLTEHGINGVAAFALLIIAWTRLLETKNKKQELENAGKSDVLENQEETARNKIQLELLQLIGTMVQQVGDTASILRTVTENQAAHSTAQDATNDELFKIVPKIDELKQAQEATGIQSEGFKLVVDKAITNQDKLLREIYAAVLRLEASVAEYKTDSAEKAEKMQQDINVVKADLVKVTTPKPPPEFIAPIESPKPETESEEKPND